MTTKRWLKRRRWSQFCGGLFLGGALVVLGTVVLAATSALIWFPIGAVLSLCLPSAYFASGSGIALIPVLAAAMLMDAIWCSRRDEREVTLFELRSILHGGPNAIWSGIRNLARAVPIVLLNVDGGAKVLAHLATQSKPMSLDELAEVFPQLKLTRLINQLRLIEGVLVWERDGLRVTLSEPLRWLLRQFSPAAVAGGTSESATMPAEPVTPESLEPHELLGISPTASAQAIKTAYRARMKECHPDRFPNLDAATRVAAERWSKSINAAYRLMLGRCGAR